MQLHRSGAGRSPHTTPLGRESVDTTMRGPLATTVNAWACGQQRTAYVPEERAGGGCFMRVRRRLEGAGHHQPPQSHNPRAPGGGVAPKSGEARQLPHHHTITACKQAFLT
jgi:hypothetical protein